jgi:hypothetical protein
MTRESLKQRNGKSGYSPRRCSPDAMRVPDLGIFQGIRLLALILLLQRGLTWLEGRSRRLDISKQVAS